MSYNVFIYTVVLYSIVTWSAYCQTSERIVYSVTDDEELYIDIYPTKGKGTSILFVHGGGFEGGNPDGERQFAEEMQQRGYQVFVMSYRLLMKGRGFGCDIPTLDKLNAIRAGVEDAAKATTFLIQHHKKYKIDLDNFYLSGSSAGAEVILQLLYNPFSNIASDTYGFKENFKFKGAISFAGAILDLRLINDIDWVPLLLFHGSEDILVPYGTAPHRFCQTSDPGWLMFFGSHAIFNKAKELNVPVEFHSYRGRGHEVAGFMIKEADLIDKFIKNNKTVTIMPPSIIEHDDLN
ncbi:alpha/beta hydrolase [Anditalea andensis]|uniref:BD-FAE-like domain-containing protein n=1 Tax=Anditalea andensis TaxID=1048983 RepID=A0A074KS71_9BACT|nr:alpha/beta hydrolase [Anditalea andensis]KEO71759.1 hypothetical protein EL17_21475 [Anditalea andensis]